MSTQWHACDLTTCLLDARCLRQIYDVCVQERRVDGDDQRCHNVHLHFSRHGILLWEQCEFFRCFEIGCVYVEECSRVAFSFFSSLSFRVSIVWEVVPGPPNSPASFFLFLFYFLLANGNESSGIGPE